MNPKLIRRIYRHLGWIQPQKIKRQLPSAAYDKRPKPTRLNELWESDLTCIHCSKDGWAYLFNAEDAVSRECASNVFAKYATKEDAILSAQNALIKHPDALGAR